ncbi:MAG TPA: sulfatase-like hydrolase/transferase, partial [Thermoguttaceae bacterium]|nr:sulfatase-like hydrolase/transferase [Thermoguttaceae bacterium]
TDAEDAPRDAASARQFEAELTAMIDTHVNHPAIVMWVPFNEGWGQYDTRRIAAMVKQRDPTRLCNAVSGWTDRGAGNVRDIHEYPGPAIEPPGPGRAAVLGEFGGLGLPIEGHLWWDRRNWGYRTYQSRDELHRNYERVVGNVYGQLGLGLAAAVYTQTTDVEGEINGLMTYDREIVKYDAGVLRKVHDRLYSQPPTVRYLLHDSKLDAQVWSYRFTPPEAGWMTSADATDIGWQSGLAPFQSGENALIPTGTPWLGKEIWLRRTFDLDRPPKQFFMKLFQNVTTVDVSINGRPVLELDEPRMTRRHYRHMDLSYAADLLKSGRNVIAVHATKQMGQRAVDLGLYATEPPEPIAKKTAPRPNIVVIMADDLGYSDLGCYGGEVQTPNLDRLAARGLRFTDFYNTSRCCPTRASLMTGLYPHQAGVGQMTFDRGMPGYRGFLTPNTVTIAEALRESGYRTGMLGKWHLSLTQEAENHLDWLDHQDRFDRDFSDPATYPVARGFEHHYGVIWGVVDYFDPFSLVRDDTPIPSVPKDYYITDAISEGAVEMIDQYSGNADPFFLYVAYTAPHWPLHAKPEDIEKYKDTYTVGWDAIREARYRRMVDMRLLEPDRAVLSPRIDRERRWEDNPNKDWDARAMAVHAAMVDRLDQGVGRIVAKLDQLGELDNTLILFFSDNGASPERMSNPGFDRPSRTRDGREIVYRGTDVLPGTENTCFCIGPMWANAANTPFRYWKKEQYEGGVATPMIAHWPDGMKT